MSSTKETLIQKMMTSFKHRFINTVKWISESIAEFNTPNRVKFTDHLLNLSKIALRCGAELATDMDEKKKGELETCIHTIYKLRSFIVNEIFDEIASLEEETARCALQSQLEEAVTLLRERLSEQRPNSTKVIAGTMDSVGYLMKLELQLAQYQLFDTKHAHNLFEEVEKTVRVVHPYIYSTQQQEEAVSQM